MTSSTETKIPCPHCKRLLANADGARMHITKKHPHKRNPFASQNRHQISKDRDDGDESIASLMIQAQIDRACDEPVEDWLAGMLP